MHDGIDRARRLSGGQARAAEMHGHRVEDLRLVGDVPDQGENAGVVERVEVEVQDLVAVAEKHGKDVAAGFAGAAGEKDAVGHMASGSGKGVFIGTGLAIPYLNRLRG